MADDQEPDDKLAPNEELNTAKQSNQNGSDASDGSWNEDDDDDAGDDGQAVAAEPLATTRSRRANAGNRMSNLIQEEEDEFYTNLYGGFHEEEDDVDFDDEEGTDAEEDYDVDSDFSIDETDEIAPEHQDVEDEPRRKRGVYKDPKPRVHASSTTPAATTAGDSATAFTTPRPKASSSSAAVTPGESRAERSFRDSTRKKTEETIKNTRIVRKKRKKIRNLEAWKPLTQEELLEEAKKTEEENLKSLENYQRTESEKLKKIKQVKRTLPPPYTTYLSLSMPILGTDKRYTRNFITHVT